MLNKVGRSLYERQKPSSLNLILNALIVIICLVFIFEIIFNMSFTSIYVKGESMLPTLVGAPGNAGDKSGELSAGGDYVFVDIHAKPDYFDIVVVKTADEDGYSYNIIKRVVAFGGDTVKLDRGQLWIKYKGSAEFKKIEEGYLSEKYNDASNVKNTYEEHVVEEGHMFLLGDNRNDSADSRERGDFSLNSLVGVVPEWSIKNKGWITSIYTFFEFTLGLNKLKNKSFGV